MFTVSVLHEGEVHAFEFDEPTSLAAVVARLDIPPSTVLTIVDEAVVPQTSMVSADLSVELIIVSSGG